MATSSFISSYKSIVLLPSPARPNVITPSHKPSTFNGNPRLPHRRFQISFSLASSVRNPNSRTAQTLISTSTKTLTTIFAICKLLLSKYIPSPPQIIDFSTNILSLSSPLFFAALRDRPSGYLNTPLTVVASGMAKWLDIYSGVLMVRVLLSWFPNIPWDKQPLSAIRDLCDPYLNLFRNIIPPVFDTLDVSPLLAFAVLGTLGSILNSSRGMR